MEGREGKGELEEMESQEKSGDGRNFSHSEGLSASGRSGFDYVRTFRKISKELEEVKSSKLYQIDIEIVR